MRVFLLYVPVAHIMLLSVVSYVTNLQTCSAFLVYALQQLVHMLT